MVEGDGHFVVVFSGDGGWVIVVSGRVGDLVEVIGGVVVKFYCGCGVSFGTFQSGE